MNRPDQFKIISYKNLRKTVGFIGLLLPFGLLVFKKGTLLPTVSDYYHSNVGFLFVGALCICGAFLLAYKGHDCIDDLISNIAGGAIIAVALFPTLGPEGYLFYSLSEKATNVIHLTSAGITFTALGLMSFVQFSKGRNGAIFKLFGILIFAFITLICVVNLIPNNDFLVHRLNALFWLEVFILEAFGASWLLKGSTLV